MTKMTKPLLRRILGAGTGLLWLAGCAPNLAYTPADLTAASRFPVLTELRFHTDAGNQSAFYLPPRAAPMDLPDPLVIAYPGIGSKALDWLDLVADAPDHTAGFLLIDYPGRGNSQGRMRPKHLPESTRGALAALERHLQTTRARLTTNAALLGHSFGCGAALQVAAELKPTRIVLVAPFTTLHKALFLRIGPLAWFNPDRMDNRERLRDICDRALRPTVTLIHGDADATIPVAMARELVRISNDCVDYHEIPRGGHLDVLETGKAIIHQGLFGKPPAEDAKHLPENQPPFTQ